jgi:hypothetical protein
MASGVIMERERFTAWVTKFALTDGILTVEAELDKDISETMIAYQRTGYMRDYAHGKDWHRTPEAALARAEEMRVAKIAAVRKQLKKLEDMVFVIPWWGGFYEY